MKELISDVEKALTATKEWVDKGWTMKFGVDSTEVNSLKAALELPNSFVYKIEAEAYWKNVQVAANEVAAWGQKAKAALEKGDLSYAEDCIYYAVFMEKPLRENPVTWTPVFKKIHAMKAA